MKRKVTLADIEGVKHIVQDVVPKVDTTVICPACEREFKKGAPTVMVEVVRRVPLTANDAKRAEFAVRVRLCKSCAEPIIRQKQEAMSRLISVLAEVCVDDVLKEIEEESAKSP